MSGLMKFVLFLAVAYSLVISIVTAFVLFVWPAVWAAIRPLLHAATA